MAVLPHVYKLLPPRLPGAALTARHYGYVHVPKKKPPHLLGPGWRWRKCFVVHPSTQAVSPLLKYQWLTKSVIIPELPDKLLSMKTPDAAHLSDFRERAEEFWAFQVRTLPQPLSPWLEVSAGFLQSALASVWQTANKYWHLKYSSLTFQPKVEAYWRRNGENFICKSNPLYILHTGKPLDLFCTNDVTGESVPPLQYSPLHLGLFSHSFDQIHPFNGCKRFCPYSFSHTVFAYDDKSRSNDQLLAHGLMQLFCLAAAEAVQNGYPVDKDLEFPLVNQGIVTNGRRFTFVCFQLNTLDFRKEAPEDGRHNVFWAGPTVNLYEQIENGVGLKGYSEECSALLLKFLMHAPARLKPSTSGFPPPRKKK